VARLVAGDQALTLDQAGEVAEPLVLADGQVLGCPGDHAFRDQVIREHGLEKRVFVG
jgi:hypothetical protein